MKKLDSNNTNNSIYNIAFAIWDYKFYITRN